MARFVGLDVTEDFIADGRDLMGADVLAEKRPLIGTIAETIDAAAAIGVHFLYSTHVAIHVTRTRSAPMSTT